MLIRYAQPIRGRRELICKGDEASVSRVWGPERNGLVERVQSVETKHSDITFTFNEPKLWSVGQQHLAYHLIKFLAGRLARKLFPENFVRLKQMRIFESEGRLAVATYSDFVPDENGVIARRERAKERFEIVKDLKKAEEIKKESDGIENLIAPQIEGLAQKFHEVGLCLAHPQANYHITDQNIVFFEITGLDPELLRHRITEERNLRLVIEFSMIFGALLKTWRGGNSGEYAKTRPLEGIVLDIFSNFIIKNTLAKREPLDFDALQSGLGPSFLFEFCLQVLGQRGIIGNLDQSMIHVAQRFLRQQIDPWVFDYFNQASVSEPQRASL